jgi:hypothetical protein
MNLTAEFCKLAGDKLRRAMLLEAKLGVRVQVLPPGGHFAVKQIDEMWDLHSGNARSDDWATAMRQNTRELRIDASKPADGKCEVIVRCLGRSGKMAGLSRAEKSDSSLKFETAMLPVVW